MHLTAFPRGVRGFAVYDNDNDDNSDNNHNNNFLVITQTVI